MVQDTTVESLPVKNAIFEAAKQCVRQLAQHVATDRPLSRRHAASMQQKLEVWAKYSGATSRQGLSLDDRLTSLPTVRSAILGLLSMITVQISQALSLPDGQFDFPNEISTDKVGKTTGFRSSSPSSKYLSSELDSKHEDTQLCKAWKTIERAIQSLFKLAAVLRDTSTSSPDIEVPSHYKRPDDVYFGDYAKLLVRRWFPHARRSLTDQLAQGIFAHRRKILYRQKHEEKLQHERLPTLPDQAVEGISHLPNQLSTLLSESTSKLPGYSENKGVSRHLVAPSLTQFSQHKTQTVIMKRYQSATVITGRTRGSLVSDNPILEYPRVPVSLEYNSPVFCPYCCKQLTASELRNWRRHVDEDLKPLFCISEACQYPLQSFALQSDWLRHMDEYHGSDWPQTVHTTTWFCDLEHEEQPEFTVVDEYRQHLDTHNLNRSKQNVLIRHNQLPGTREPGICPLCEEAPKYEVPTGVYTLFDHVAVHLRRIALMALPAADILDIKTDGNPNSLQSDAAMAADSSSGLQNSLSRSSNHSQSHSRYNRGLTIDTDIAEAYRWHRLDDEPNSPVGFTPVGFKESVSFGPPGYLEHDLELPSYSEQILSAEAGRSFFSGFMLYDSSTTDLYAEPDVKATIICDICELQISGQSKWLKSNLARHKREQHGGRSKEFICAICGKSFARQGNLRNHNSRVRCVPAKPESHDSSGDG